MRKDKMRVGDYVKDTSNYNYECRADVKMIECSYIFSPVPLSERFLSSFRKEGDIYYRNEGKVVATLSQNEGSWNLRIRTESCTFEGTIRSVGELQHLLSDCDLDWDICV